MVKVVKGKIGPKEQAARALREKNDGLSIPPFLRRTETPEQEAARLKRQAAKKEDTIKLKVIEPYNPNDPIRKAIAKDLKEPKHPATAEKQEATVPSKKAAKAKTKAKTPKASKAKTDRFAEMMAAAKAGKIPPTPTISHKSYKKHAEAIAALAKKKDVAALKKYDPSFADFTKGENRCIYRTPIGFYRQACIAALGG